MNLPECKTLKLEPAGGVLHLTLDRPEARNAMSGEMADEIVAVFDAIADDRSVRTVVIRGAEGNFCAGGDIKDMAKARQTQPEAGKDPVVGFSRRFGSMLRHVNQAPQAVVAVIEGAVLGGGFGLACVSDVAIAHREAKFGLPETGLGLPPAQIAPFVVERIGLTQARRLGVCGGRFGGDEALSLGLVHVVAANEEEIQARLDEILRQIRRCAPNANAVTKRLMQRVGRDDMDEILDYAAEAFAQAVRGEEGTEGTTAFIEKRKPRWAEEGS